ncbi:MAG: hypothetical protein HY011_34080 [Acidobacteria bacterium]|nr:hypothetical protein [Acidobacteriota bacterium]
MNSARYFTKSVCNCVYESVLGWDGTARVSKRRVKFTPLAEPPTRRLLTRAVPS